MVRYISPVNPAVYPHLAITLLGIGLFFMAWFFVYPQTIVTVSSTLSKSIQVMHVGMKLHLGCAAVSVSGTLLPSLTLRLRAWFPRLFL